MEDNLKVYNKYDKEVNILHFQGKNLEQFINTSLLIYESCKLNPLEENLSIVSCWTDNEKCILNQQFEKNNLILHNALPNNYGNNRKWDMRNKIEFYIDYLENNIDTDIVVLVDGYDVLFTSTKDIVNKFTSQPYHILFNSTANNYPFVNIDKIQDREKYDRFAPFFNAGCCIGYRKDLINFYKECYQIIDIPNQYNSEQYVLRNVFSKYSNIQNQNFVWIDFKRDIFNSMGYMMSNYNAETNTLHIYDNLLIPQNKRDIEKLHLAPEIS